jgi:precorrin-6B methylase 2
MEAIVDQSALSNNALVERMFQLSSAYIDARALWIVAKLGIADLLAAGPKPVAELAQATSTQADALHRVMRLVAANGALTESEPGKFALTAFGELLRSDSPSSMRDWVLWTGGPLCESFRDALHSVQTGSPAFEKVHGVKIYDYLKDHPDDARALNGAMVAYSREMIGALLGSCNFRDTYHLVDVGAGPGAIDIAVLRAHPKLRATLFDLPHVAERAKRVVEEAGLTDRAQVVAGSFFETVPEGGDLYLLSAVLHNWSDEECDVILKKCRRALDKGGRLLVLEMIMPPSDTPHFAKKSDVVMLTALGGRERTVEQYSVMLAKAGFRLTKAHQSPYLIQLLEAEPA